VVVSAIWRRISNDVGVKNSIQERVAETFKGDKYNISKDYLEQIYTNMHITETTLRQSIIRLFFLFFLFLLVMNTKNSELDLGIIKVTDISLILKFIPLLISINYYELISLILIYFLQQRMVMNILYFLHKPIVDNDLDEILFSSSIPHSIEIILTHMTNENGIVNSINIFLYALTILIIMFGAIVFECSIFYSCFQKFGTSDWLLWMILIISLIIILKSILSVILSVCVDDKKSANLP
jgi:hypothetical protein